MFCIAVSKCRWYGNIKSSNPIILCYFTLRECHLPVWFTQINKQELFFMKYKGDKTEPCTYTYILILFVSFAVLICHSRVYQSKSKVKSNPGCHHGHPWTQITFCGQGWYKPPILIHRKEHLCTQSLISSSTKDFSEKVLHISNMWLILCLSQHATYHT